MGGGRFGVYVYNGVNPGVIPIFCRAWSKVVFGTLARHHDC